MDVTNYQCVEHSTRIFLLHALILQSGYRNDNYSNIEQVMVNGEVYAAKMIHEALLRTDEPGGVETVIQNYIRECRLMARIRHPQHHPVHWALFLG